MLPICCPSPSRCGARRAEGSRAGPCPPVPIARSLRHHPSRRTSRSGDHDMGVQMSSFCGRLTHRRDRRGFTPTRGKIRVPNVAVRPSATARPTTRRLRGTAFGAPPSSATATRSCTPRPSAEPRSRKHLNDCLYNEMPDFRPHAWRKTRFPRETDRHQSPPLQPATMTFLYFPRAIDYT